MSLADYFGFTLSWMRQVQRVVRPTGSIWVHGTYHNIGLINFAMQLLELEIINEVVWYKRNSFPNLSGRRLTASHESILWAHTGKKREYYFDYDASKAFVADSDTQRSLCFHTCNCSSRRNKCNRSRRNFEEFRNGISRCNNT